MYALTIEQVDQVHGGVPLPILIGVFGAVWAGASAIEDFAQGFAEGWEEKRIEKTGS